LRNLTATTKFERHASIKVHQLDSPAYLLNEMDLGAEANKLVVDTGTASTFFPFVSADLIESPAEYFLA
jgi:hypothetical protein